MSILLIFQLFLSSAICVFIISLLRPLAKKIDLLDHPNSNRKVHQGAIPLIGGIAIFCTFCIVSLLANSPLGFYRSLFLGGGIITFLGVLDDYKSVSPRFRLIMQFIVALIVMSQSNILISNLGNLLNFGIIPLNQATSVLLTLFCIVALINAVNMIDGLDGLVGLISLSSIVWFIVLSYLYALQSYKHCLFIILGALLGFLLFNLRHPWRKKASVFLGDGGSTLLGFLLAWFSLSIIYNPMPHHAPIRPVVLLWILFLPISDLIFSSIRRMINGGSPFQADKGHLHHVLLELGFSVRKTVFLMFYIAILAGGIGVAFNFFNCPDYISFLLFVVFLGFYSMFLVLCKKNSIVQKEGQA